MEKVNERSYLTDTFYRFTEPAKYKLKFYHIATMMFIEHLLSQFVQKIINEKNKIEYPNKIKQELYSNDAFIRVQLVLKKFLSYTKCCIRKFNDVLQSMNDECLSDKETPILFCEPYIQTGFRPVNKPYFYYMKSSFSKHNETVNAWSHYIGAIYTLSLTYRYDWSDPYSWPIITCILTSSSNLLLSATAHLMHQKSQKTHITCFLCDYSGISFNVFGCSLMVNYICSPIWYYNFIKPVILTFSGFLSCMCCVLNCLAITLYKRPYPPIKRIMQFAPCGIAWGFVNLPVFIHYFSSQRDMTLNYENHFKGYALFIFGAACFAFDIPQRFYPGKMDFIGQGHHLFHICVLMVSMYQLDAVYTDFLTNRDIIAASRPPPTFAFCFISLLAVAFFYIYIISRFYKLISHNFDEEGNAVMQDESIVEQPTVQKIKVN